MKARLLAKGASLAALATTLSLLGSNVALADGYGYSSGMFNPFCDSSNMSTSSWSYTVPHFDFDLFDDNCYNPCQNQTSGFNFGGYAMPGHNYGYGFSPFSTGGGVQSADVSGGTSTTVNSSINATSGNDTTVLQAGGAGVGSAGVSGGSNTTVNSEINAGSQQSTSVLQY